MVANFRFAVAASIAATACGSQCLDADVSLLQVTVQSAAHADTADAGGLELSFPTLQDHGLRHAHAANASGAMPLAPAANVTGAHLSNVTGTGATPIGDMLRRRLLASGVAAHRKIADLPSSSWPVALRGKSVLVLGDSLDRNAVRYLCHTNRAITAPYLDADLASLSGASSYDFCRVGGVTVGQFMNYGVFEPPYWMYAYKEMNVNKHFMVPDGLQDTSDQHILLDASRFKTVTPAGQDPTLVVVQSCLWDVAARWHAADGSALGRGPSHDFVGQWAARLQNHIDKVRQAFPNSRIAWRTASPAPEPGTNQEILRTYMANDHVYPDLIRHMNQAARDFAGQNDVEIIDYAAIVEQPGGPTIHGMAYMNAVLNILEERS